ncbi:unnamed protein product [Phyllotreta striolata]|uniref:Uncharacterized protein n=1 Tax=Phyllotreta striolata TaxID=444603 RepID=A0A9N9TVY3_PHYSR|nr:unnamed protein product [Phyllotreta striolata]
MPYKIKSAKRTNQFTPRIPMIIAMKLQLALLLIIHVLVDIVHAAPGPLWGLFGNYNYGYSRRNYGNSYDDGGDRYRSICRIHAIDSLAFPGRIGAPVCP